MPSCPRIVPGFISVTVPRTKCRSVPQMALAVSRTIASVGSSIFGSFTSSRPMSPTPFHTTAFIKDLLRRALQITFLAEKERELLPR